MDLTDILAKLKELGPWILSSIALFQVWGIALFKKFRSPTIDVFESANIEIGYANFGGSVGVIGTFRCLHKDAFITRISLKVTSLKDGAQRNLYWQAFREIIITKDKPEEIKFQTAKSFLLVSEKAHDYNIFFCDEEWISRTQVKAKQLFNEWQQNNPDESLESFPKSAVCTEIYSILDREFPWKAEEYKLSMIIETSRPDKTYTKEWRFRLTEDDIKSLRLNSVHLIRLLVGLPVNYNFAYPRYSPPPKTNRLHLFRKQA